MIALSVEMEIRTAQTSAIKLTSRLTQHSVVRVHQDLVIRVTTAMTHALVHSEMEAMMAPTSFGIPKRIRVGVVTKADTRTMKIQDAVLIRTVI